MSWPYLVWWRCFLISAGCYAVAIAIVKAEYHGYVSSICFIIELFVATAGTAFFVLGLVRFVKWIWFLKNSNSRLGSVR
jgi:hypothetical protein